MTMPQDAARLSPEQQRHLVRAYGALRGDQARLLSRKRHLAALLQACLACSCFGASALLVEFDLSLSVQGCADEQLAADMPQLASCSTALVLGELSRTEQALSRADLDFCMYLQLQAGLCARSQCSVCHGSNVMWLSVCCRCLRHGSSRRWERCAFSQTLAWCASVRVLLQLRQAALPCHESSTTCCCNDHGQRKKHVHGSGCQPSSSNSWQLPACHWGFRVQGFNLFGLAAALAPSVLRGTPLLSCWLMRCCRQADSRVHRTADELQPWNPSLQAPHSALRRMVTDVPPILHQCWVDRGQA